MLLPPRVAPQVARLLALRARRDPGAWRAALDALEAKARTSENLVPAIVDAVLAWATVGEIAGCLRATGRTGGRASGTCPPGCWT